MQQYEPASIQTLRHQYDTPTFKTNALHLVSNEGRLKRLLSLYKGLLQPATHFDSYDTPTFKTEALRLICNEGWLEHLLLLYKGLI